MNRFKANFFTIEDPFLYISWWSFVIGFIVAVGVSLFTKPVPFTELKGLVYNSKDS
jgi:SSS family solute:Na+ symporter